MVLDEPTTALTDSEVDILMNFLENLRKSGVSCIYISHKLEEISVSVTALPLFVMEM